MSDQRATPYLYLIITMAFFGAAFTSSKVIVGELPHTVAAAVRFGGGALVLVLLLLVRPGTQSFNRRDALRAGGAGLIGVTGYNILFFWAISLAPATDGSVLVPVTAPVLTTLFFVLTGKEPATARRVGGLAVAVAGSAVFFVGIEFTPARLLGDLLYFGCAALWAIYSVLSKKILGGVEPLRATTYATGAGALGLLLLALPSLPETRWTEVSATGWVNVVFLAIGPTALAYYFYARGLQSVSAVTATVMMFAAPVFGTVFSVVFLGEPFTAVQLAGAIITIIGALFAVTQKEKVDRVGAGVAA